MNMSLFALAVKLNKMGHMSISLTSRPLQDMRQFFAILCISINPRHIQQFQTHTTEFTNFPHNLYPLPPILSHWRTF